ncbi:unnamed protein product [Hymenolepis diminuta]|uniref:Uncharacterized protein n=1 Tax=Hymenolepis diminuta TaxID=6216 RepID=A0A564YS77_HYMDI|nr:unnamed protein product [Hymenolepis diminuta]
MGPIAPRSSSGYGLRERLGENEYNLSSFMVKAVLETAEKIFTLPSHSANIEYLEEDEVRRVIERKLLRPDNTSSTSESRATVNRNEKTIKRSPCRFLVFVFFCFIIVIISFCFYIFRDLLL